MKHAFKTLILIVATTTIAYAMERGGRYEHLKDRLWGQVDYVIDGDTFTMHMVERRLRIWGIDAPEMDEPDGEASKAALAELIDMQSLECERKDVDRYGRDVLKCRLEDGRDIASVMIEAGHASEYCRYSKGYYGTCGK